jgi:hypothetical protein
MSGLPNIGEYRVSNHEAAPSFETHRFAMLLRMRRSICCSTGGLATCPP